MTALEIAMAGYLAFGQPTGNYYEAITKHAGLQVIHSNCAVTLRLAEVGREESAADGAKTIVVRLKDEHYPFEVARYIKTWGDCAAVETWAEIRHFEPGPVRLVRADSFASPVVVTSDVVRVLSLTGIAKNEANVSRSSVGNGQSVELVSSAGTRNAWEANASMMVEFGDGVDEERGKVGRGNGRKEAGFRRDAPGGAHQRADEKKRQDQLDGPPLACTGSPDRPDHRRQLEPDHRPDRQKSDKGEE